MSPSNEPRLVDVSRRAFLRRGAVAGALVAFPTALSACGSDDADAFAESEAGTTASTEAGSTGSTATADSSTSTDAVPTTAEEVSPSTESTESTVAAGSILTGAEMVVAFTYEAGTSSRGPVRNPYIAVWVEDTAGNLVDTISVWYLQSQKGLKWIDDLRRWYTASGQAADTSMSGATRVAGSYTVAWDGTDLAGTPVATGDYVLFIEAAREHGPYSITSTPITVGDEGFSVALPDDGEIVSGTAELIV